MSSVASTGDCSGAVSETCPENETTPDSMVPKDGSVCAPLVIVKYCEVSLSENMRPDAGASRLVIVRLMVTASPGSSVLSPSASSKSMLVTCNAGVLSVTARKALTRPRPRRPRHCTLFRLSMLSEVKRTWAIT